ncbi:MAG: PIN domain-containing protein [Nitrospirota bacterium]
MFIVFDSNIWFSEMGLNSTKGAAARFFINQKGAKVALPEVIKLETEHNLKNMIRKLISAMVENHRQLLTIFGRIKELVLPDENEIEERVKKIFSQVKVKIVELPFTFESAKSSFIKIIDKQPPSNTTEEFRDGVIWADCLSLLKSDDVYLITNDKHFYNSRSYDKGLAKNLADEASIYKNTIKIFPGISELIAEIKSDIKIDNHDLVNAFIENNREKIAGTLERNGFEITGKPIVKSNLYVTEDPNRLYIEFEIQYLCNDLSLSNRADAKLILRGDGNYLLDKNAFLEMRNFGEELVFKLENGEEKQLKGVVIFAGPIVIGHQTVEHSVKYKLE